jgi:hypothetical protein
MGAYLTFRRMPWGDAPGFDDNEMTFRVTAAELALTFLLQSSNGALTQHFASRV